MSLTSQGWSAFFIAAGISNLSQSLFFHYLRIPSTSAAVQLGHLGDKPSPASESTWALVAVAGSFYALHGVKKCDFLPWGVVVGFAALKFAVASKMYKIIKKGKRGALTAAIGASEVAWGGAFLYWGVQKAMGKK